MAANEPSVTGDKLKKLIKKSRSMPIPFGFNPGTSDDDDEFLMAHPRKPPELMGKIALTEGAGTKSAFGTFAISDSEVHLCCFRVIPMLAKKFKKYLKVNKIKLNVVVMDPDGNILESDIEELDDWFREEGDDEDDEPAAPAAQAPGAPAAAPPPKADPLQALAGLLTDRLKVIQPRIQAAPGPVAQKLAVLFKTAVGQIRGGQMREGAATITSIEALLARVEKVPGAPAAPPPPPARTGPDPRLPKLRDALVKMQDRAEQVLGEGGEVIQDDLARLGAQLELGEVEAVLRGLAQAQDRIAEAAQARARWDRVGPEVEDRVLAALKSGGPEAGSLRARWGFAKGLAEVGDWGRAVNALPGIINLLKAQAPAAAAPAPEVAAGTVAFQKARVLWVSARTRMLAEAERLADAIVAASADDEDAADIAAAAGEIVTGVRRIDDRLQDVLDRLTNAADAAERDALKREAAGVIAAYRATLASGLFPAIDQNPFQPVTVAAGARMALDQIARTLA
jgi:hypothetical protein